MAQFRKHRLQNIAHSIQVLRQMHISTHAAHACYFILLSIFPLLVLILGILRYTSLQPEDFLDYYSANGWMIGNQPIRDWKAVARRWSRKEKNHGTFSYAGFDLGSHC